MKLLWINWKKVFGSIRLRAVSGAEGVKANVVFVLNFQSDGISNVKSLKTKAGIPSGQTGRISAQNGRTREFGKDAFRRRQHL